jgi:tRNA isopentenyl-2-thiomethyl-A-37 hydroxylase MiaE
MLNTRNLTWKLNWYRHSELEGALLLGRVVRAATDAQLVMSLTRHCADEARHGWLWARTIEKLNLPTVQIYRSYQSFYLRSGNMPASLPDVLALTHVFEKRVDEEFRRELQDPHLPDPAAQTFRTLLADEQDHLDWVGRWLAGHPDGSKLVEKYQRIDREVYEELLPYRDRVWAVPDLGRELPAAA